MNEKYLQDALVVIPDRRVLVNAACRRASELARGGRPLIHVPPEEQDSYIDIALQEIAAGKVTLKFEEEAEPAVTLDF